MKLVRLSALRIGRLYTPLPLPGNIPCTHFCQRMSRPQGHSGAGRSMSIKNSATFWLVTQFLSRMPYLVSRLALRGSIRGQQRLRCLSTNIEGNKGSGSMTLLVSNLGSRCRWLVSLTLQQLILRGRGPVGSKLNKPQNLPEQYNLWVIYHNFGGICGPQWRWFYSKRDDNLFSQSWFIANTARRHIAVIFALTVFHAAAATILNELSRETWQVNWRYNLQLLEAKTEECMNGRGKITVQII